MTSDPTAAATKQDLQELKNELKGEIKSSLDIMRSELKVSVNFMKDELKTSMEFMMKAVGDLYSANERWKDEIIEHFDLTVEHIKHEMSSANREEIEVLKDKVKIIEEHVGLAA